MRQSMTSAIYFLLEMMYIKKKCGKKIVEGWILLILRMEEKYYNGREKKKSSYGFAGRIAG